MVKSFDETRWREAIKQPDWYRRLAKEGRRFALLMRKKPDSPEAQELKRQLREFFEGALERDEVALGTSGPDLDRERAVVDTIVIHHTSAEPGYRISYMNALQMLSIYVPYFLNPTVKSEKGLKNQPLWSNHFRDGKPVFYVYHWFVRMDGTTERLLEDKQIGWHAGNWDINCRSVGICLDNDYENKDPEPAMLERLADLIAKNYPKVSPERIIGHREAREGTTCPGNGFLDGWKDELQRLVRERR
jgi:hypothetical protein